MKTSLIALCLIALPAMAQFHDGGNLYWQPDLNVGSQGGTLTDGHGNVWTVTPNINTAPGASVTRQKRIYRFRRNQDYRENYGARGAYRQ